MPAITTEHFVMNLTIDKVERVIDPNTSSGKRDRVVDDSVRITLKAPTMTELLTKLESHVRVIRFTETEEETQQHD